MNNKNGCPGAGATMSDGLIDVDRLLASVDLEQVVGHYVALKRSGRELVGRCVWHAPDVHPSMRVIPHKGLIWCPACGQGGDVLAFLQQHLGIGFREACKLLNGGAPDWTPISPITDVRVAKPPPAPRETAKPPPDAPEPDMATRELGKPVEVRAIRDLDGSLLGYECRYPRDDEGKSASRVWTWGRTGDKPFRWGCGVFSRPRPLYGLDRLGARPGQRVCITEGPKKADAVAALMAAYVGISWTGGHQSWKYHDWTPIEGLECLLWPDADQVGMESMQRLGEMLLHLGCKVRYIDPTGQPEGWDAADALSEGWDWAKVKEWASARVRWLSLTVEDAPPDAPDAPETRPEEGVATPIATPPEKRAPRPVKPVLGIVDGNAVRAVRAPRVAEDGEPLPVALSDFALADYWVHSYGEDWRYVRVWDQWFNWRGDTWAEDTTARYKSLAVRVAQAAAHWPEAAALTPDAKRKLSSIAKAGNIVSVLQCNQDIAAGVDQWDTDSWLLGVPGGVVDLRTGELLEGRREDYIRLQAAVAPADPETAEIPQWQAFLERVQPDPEVRAYLRRLAGYCLTGLTREHVLAFMYGGGANGKSTFINTLSGIMGGYSKVAGMETFTDGMHGHTQELARLAGARIVSAEETGSGHRWDEARIKALTGGSPVTANFMRMNSFEFEPQFKLLIAGNHLPKLRTVGEGMRRRLHLVPWTVQIPARERDVNLMDKLKAEWPAILRWAIGGCLDYQFQGLAVPAIVDAAGREYLEDQDTVGNWRVACTEDAPGERVQSSDLYHSYKAWCEAQEVGRLGQTAFVEALLQAGCERTKSNGVRYIKGVKLRSMEERLQDAAPARGRDWD